MEAKEVARQNSKFYTKIKVAGCEVCVYVCVCVRVHARVCVHVCVYTTVTLHP